MTELVGDIPVAIFRAAQPEDQAYCASTWVMSMTRGRQHGRNVQALRMLVDAMLDRPDVTVTIAENATRTGHILGWMCVTRLVGQSLLNTAVVLHYGYIRDGYRRRGLFREMLGSQRIDPMAKGMMYSFEGPTTKALTKTMLAKAIHIQPSTFLEMR